MASAIEVLPADAPCGAEIRGADLSQDLPGDVIFELLQAFRRHMVLVFREQQLSDDRLLQVGEWFGSPYSPPTGIPVLGDAEQTGVTKIANVDGGLAGAKPIPHHTDLQYMPVPLLGAMLYAKEVPASGGDTSWSNLCQAYDELPDAMKKRLDGVKGIGINPYVGEQSAKQTAGENQFFVETGTVPDFPHPIVRTHPDTGRPTLYMSMFITRMCEADGSPAPPSLIAELNAHVDQPHLYFRHHWQPNDVVIWDNRCTNHKREDFSAQSRRVLHRIQIAGTRPF